MRLERSHTQKAGQVRLAGPASLPVTQACSPDDAVRGRCSWVQQRASAPKAQSHEKTLLEGRAQVSDSQETARFLGAEHCRPYWQ